MAARAGDKGEDSRTTSLPVSTTRLTPSKKTARMGDKAKPPGVGPRPAGGFAVFGFGFAKLLELLRW